MDGEYNALCKRERDTWNYIQQTTDMNPIPFIWDFRMKDTVGLDLRILNKARCSLQGDKQLAISMKQFESFQKSWCSNTVPRSA